MVRHVPPLVQWTSVCTRMLSVWRAFVPAPVPCMPTLPPNSVWQVSWLPEYVVFLQFLLCRNLFLKLNYHIYKLYCPFSHTTNFCVFCRQMYYFVVYPSFCVFQERRLVRRVQLTVSVQQTLYVLSQYVLVLLTCTKTTTNVL